MTSSRTQITLIGGFTAIFIGYLSVWLPGPGAGLSFLGIEMGEWFKFVGLGARRDIFYLPPITLGLILAIWTMTWPENNWRAWCVRALAFLVSLLAFPAVEDITGPVRDQYTLRVYMIALVGIVCLVSGLWKPGKNLAWIPWVTLAILGVIGGLLPTWMVLNARSYAAQIIGVSIGIGFGVWLNVIGHFLVVGISLIQIPLTRRSRMVVT